VSPPLVDAAARARIETDLDVNLCVEAGAGTGKTTMLVKRVVALLRTGRATVDDLAVITFTEKAAGELSARVRFALEQALEEHLLGEERARVEQALLDLYRARIQTLHAFAGDLLRERPVEARLDPEFETMDDLAAELHFDDAYRGWLDEQLAERNEPVERAMRRGFDLPRLRKLVEEVHRHREVLPLQPAPWSPPDVRAFRVAAADWAAQLTALEPRCTDAEDDLYPQLEALRDFCEEVERAPEDADVERLLLFEAPAAKLVGSQDRWEDGACKQVKDLFREYRPWKEELRAALRTDALVELLPLAAGFAQAYAEQRRTEGLADFDDLLLWARDLVRDDEHVRAYFHRRSPRILVDEFQDTDPIQSELVTWICAPAGATGTWREVIPEPGSLFIVGDPKQSIYRFRGADISVYDSVKRGPLAGEVEYLVQNFRASEEVLGWVNGVFDRVLEEKEGIQPPNTPLEGQVSMRTELSRSPIVLVHSEEEAGSADELRSEESSLLARTISRAVRDEEWPIRERRAGDAVRAVQWRDIAILVPSRTGIERLEAALQRHGVPYRFEGGRGFFSRQEVRDLVSLLHAIDDPTDVIAIVAVLRSLAFGCSDEDLLGWQLEHGRFDYRRVDGETTGPEPVREAMATLRDLNRASRGLSLAELVRKAIERTGLVEAALSLPSGRQSAANVMKLLDHAREFSAAGGGALRAFTSWLGRMREREADEVDAPVAEERDDRVRVMTIHAAKGLEFPVVCLGNLESTGSNDTPPVPDVEHGRVELKLGSESDGTAFCTPGWLEVKEREKQALAAERDRLLYVACTRARDHVVIPVCTVPSKARGFMARLMPSLPQPDVEHAGEDLDGCWLYDVALLESVEAVPAASEATAHEGAVAGAVAERERWDAEREALVRERARGVEVVTASSVKVDPRPLVAEAATSGGEGGPVIDVGSAPPLELGDAFHRVMEMVSLPEGEDLEEIAAAICTEAGIAEATGAVVEMGRRCLASQPLSGSTDGEDVYREVPFVTGHEGEVLIGRIDLLVRTERRTLIVDYKTDGVTRGAEPLAAQEHRGQVAAYLHAVRTAANAESTATLLFARTGTAVEVS
jgi:ATP-dependent exoDNAse (exonuclease V) beta subunit